MSNAMLLESSPCQPTGVVSVGSDDDVETWGVRELQINGHNQMQQQTDMSLLEFVHNQRARDANVRRGLKAHRQLLPLLCNNTSYNWQPFERIKNALLQTCGRMPQLFKLLQSIFKE